MKPINDKLSHNIVRDNIEQPVFNNANKFIEYVDIRLHS